MPLIRATYDGTVFVPTGPVDLPEGSAVEVLVPSAGGSFDVAIDVDWQEFLDEVRSGEPAFPTVEEALGQSRKRA